ncbi:hypothetical protein AU188_01930 [Mycobacterium sp. IS-3022]|nr:hypothetical protein AU188_01930 [Mycobacterium sp. IS-3022]
MTYFQAFLVFLMVLSPVLLPAVITLCHTMIAWRRESYGTWSYGTWKPTALRQKQAAAAAA